MWSNLFYCSYLNSEQVEILIKLFNSNEQTIEVKLKSSW